jgi:UrcA family protein
MSKLLLSLAIVLTAPAVAQDRMPDIHVAYQDLNLATPDGVRILDHRIAAAVDRACPDPARTDLRTALEIDRCRHDKSAEAAGEKARVMAAAQSATRLASAR